MIGARSVGDNEERKQSTNSCDDLKIMNVSSDFIRCTDEKTGNPANKCSKICQSAQLARNLWLNPEGSAVKLYSLALAFMIKPTTLSGT